MRAKNILLIIFSFLFYAYGEPIYVLLMLASTLLNYILGRLVDSERSSGRKAFLIIAIVVNLAFLGVFKYTDMIVETINAILSTSIPLPQIRLPIGISFFTFQAMSYVIDIYKGTFRAQKNFPNIMLYISFFPQLIAGPIIKYNEIESQISFRTHSQSDVAIGLRRFIIGLSKKVLIANTVGATADALFAMSTTDMNILAGWIAAIAYMLQIYFDFSGYSDMAIGIGRMFGFKFPENFKYPYCSKSIKEFWRRWHISLSTWFRDYLYIPLGGNRKGKVRTAINKIIVFFATGIWHGANWTFVVWGLYHGAFLLLEDALHIKKIPNIIKHVYAILVVCVGFVVFRADTLAQGLQIIGKMFTGFDFSSHKMSFALEQLTPSFIVAVIVGCIIAFPLLEWVKRILATRPKVYMYLNATTFILSVVMLIICMLNLSGGTYNPFIYFRF